MWFTSFTLFLDFYLCFRYNTFSTIELRFNFLQHFIQESGEEFVPSTHRSKLNITLEGGGERILQLISQGMLTHKHSSALPHNFARHPLPYTDDLLRKVDPHEEEIDSWLCLDLVCCDCIGYQLLQRNSSGTPIHP